MKHDPYQALTEILDRHRVAPSDAVVYHYTSLDALQSILGGDSPALRASDLRFLNDSAERSFGEEMFRAELEARRDHAGYERILAALEAQESAYESEEVTLVAALSRARDSLSQWRGYGRDETGAAIGFRVSGLSADAVLYEVIYGGRDAEALVRRFVDAVLAMGAEADELPGDGHRLAALHNRLVSILKHAAFADEQELRIYRNVPLKECRFRCSGRFLIPYQDIGFERDAVAEVVLAPGEHAEIRRLGVQLFLRRWGYDAPVRISGVPFRP